MLPELGSVVEQRRAELLCKAQRVGEGLHEITEHVVTVCRALGFRGSGERRRSAGGDVRHRKEDLHERDAVGVAMVDADDDRAAAVVVLDDVELPQRPYGIERRGGESAYERLQLALAGSAGKRDMNDVMIEIEVVGGLPERGRRRLHGTLKEAAKAHEALGHHSLHGIQADRLREGEHGADHHQVARTIHPQPCGIDRRNLFAPCHAKCSSGTVCWT